MNRIEVDMTDLKDADTTCAHAIEKTTKAVVVLQTEMRNQKKVHDAIEQGVAELLRRTQK